ncbi:putative signal transducing protein [Polaribacter sp. Hel1_85]|uniref:putative signal transducing protein n=1 Tax=Polaribacter sp. Hel1_85 TaxID=1250005 RepID=UPI00052DA5B8|nr:DUF2007 domain-containing protein [Polaribacter sp. Hel1_85]KGL58676.1 hypothetical protein PHEL85_2941 [Polaribacter sp. Hel1_85]
MTEEYTKVFTESTIIVKRLHTILKEAGVSSRLSDRVESARLGGFGVPPNSVELFVLNEDIKKAQPIIDSFKEKINS